MNHEKGPGQKEAKSRQSLYSLSNRKRGGKRERESEREGEREGQRERESDGERVREREGEKGERGAKKV